MPVRSDGPAGADAGTDPIEADVCVVGAGPAGLALALMLARSGVRVVLAERSTHFRRDFRGEILQPGGQAVLDALGVLAPARERGACELDGFQLIDRGRVLLDIGYRRLPKPYDHLLAIPQAHLLEELLAACRRCPTFGYLDGHRLTELLTEGDRVVGAVFDTAVARPASSAAPPEAAGTAADPVPAVSSARAASGPPARAGGPAASVASSVSGSAGRRTVLARVVVGADGRFSKTRGLAGIDSGRRDVFGHDVAWFRLEAPDRMTGHVRIHRQSGGAVLVHDSYPGRLQVGWVLPHRRWPTIAAGGVAGVRAALEEALPAFRDLIAEQVTSLARLKLLDVFAAQADEWVREGLVLVGDSAHTLGPLGAQGINLALQDAALLHPLLLEGPGRLDEFARARRPAIGDVMKMQRMQARGMLARGNRLADVLRPCVAGLINRTPLGTKITNRIAYGRDSVPVRTDLFIEG